MVQILVARSLSKRFGGALALNNVNISIGGGQVRGIVGENGSGKSTFIKVLAGYHKPDQGELELNGRPVGLPVKLGNLADCYLAFVHQDLGLVGELTVVENFFVREYASSVHPLKVPWSAYEARVQKVLAQNDIYGVSPSTRVDTLTPLQRALVAIIRASDEIERSGALSSILVLDEPTVYLPVGDREHLYSLIREVVGANHAVLLVSHDIDEVLAVCDEVTVFRDGAVIDTVASRETDRRRVISLMVGELGARKSQETSSTTLAGDTPKRESARGATVTLSDVRSRQLCPLSATFAAGEIVGLAGVAGSGYDQVPRLLFGAVRGGEGELTVSGRTLDLAKLSPARAIRAGVAFVPGDRVAEGGVASLTLSENVGVLTLGKFYKKFILRMGDAERNTVSLLKEFDVRPSLPGRELWTLSGGNQQKAIFAKWSQVRPALLLLQEPTQGVDVGARERIWDVMRGAAAAGSVVLVASSDYVELASVCDRVLAIKDGQVSGELHGPNLSKATILAACYREPAAAESEVLR
jgi:ribose transport system ATP-binding protein